MIFPCLMPNAIGVPIFDTENQLRLRIFALKINSKFELRRVCRTVGATSIVRSGPPLPEECGYVESMNHPCLMVYTNHLW